MTTPHPENKTKTNKQTNKQTYKVNGELLETRPPLVPIKKCQLNEQEDIFEHM